MYKVIQIIQTVEYLYWLLREILFNQQIYIYLQVMIHIYKYFFVVVPDSVLNYFGEITMLSKLCQFPTVFSTQFYVTFWLLSIYDLCTPNSAYEKQVQQQKAQIQTIENSNDWVRNKLLFCKHTCHHAITLNF